MLHILLQGQKWQIKYNNSISRENTRTLLSHSSHSLLLPLSNQPQLTRDDVKDFITTIFSICISHIYSIKRCRSRSSTKVPPERQSPQHGEHPAANASAPKKTLFFLPRRGVTSFRAKQKLKEAVGGRILLQLRTKKKPSAILSYIFLFRFHILFSNMEFYPVWVTYVVVLKARLLNESKILKEKPWSEKT